MLDFILTDAGGVSVFDVVFALVTALLSLSLVVVKEFDNPFGGMTFNGITATTTITTTTATTTTMTEINIINIVLFAMTSAGAELFHSA